MNRPKGHIKVLLIEDEPAHVRLIRRYLSCVPNVSFDIRHADQLKAGLGILSQQDDIDIILTDLGLPDSPDHQHTLPPILEAAPQTPVIVLTAINNFELGLEAIERGAQDYLPKDQLNSELLVRSIQHALYRKQTELQLRQINDTLEQRVAERTAVSEQRAAKLRLLATELSEAEQRERRRLAQLLHDNLQQSLVAIKMRISLLPHLTDTGKREEAVAQIDTYLQRAIDESRSLAMQLSPPILADQGLGAALEWLGNRMKEEHGLSVTVNACDPPSNLPDDAASFLFQAVRELLFNAVKYAKTDKARVEMGCPEPSELRIEVSDEGVGFDTSRLDGPDQTAEHFGIFSIRQRLQLIGGQLEVDSTPGKGTTAILSLPIVDIAEATADQTPVEATLGPEGSGSWKPSRLNLCRVVLVDDHNVVREGIRVMLSEESDMQIVGEASDGEEALRVVRECQPDVVVMDITMPRMTGIEATREISRHYPHVRVVGLSMYPEDDMGPAMIEAGADAYLPKDGPAENLVRTIRSLAKGQPASTS